MLHVFRSPVPLAHHGASRRVRAWALVCALTAGGVLSGCASGPAVAPLAAAASSGSSASSVSGTPAVDPVSLFPLDAYDQNVDHWIDPSSPGYDTPFLSPDEQRAQFAAFYARYFGSGADDPSPWNPAFVRNRVYREGGSDIAALQAHRLDNYDNTDKPANSLGYGMNFRPHTKAWIDAIAQNIDVAQFTRAAAYDPAKRAIATSALLVRELPTNDPSFYDHRLAGEGYPFDNLQVSAERPGTPLYVLGTSEDGGWTYVQAPDVQGWVKSDGLARVDNAFVARWRSMVARSPGVVIDALPAVRDTHGVFRFDAPAGTLLPLQPSASAAGGRVVAVPARDTDGRAVIRMATLPESAIVPAPFAATPRHLATLMKALIGRPYGWGNANLDNDCSGELQSIFAAFGVWLPRHSSTQMSAGDMTDLSSSSTAERLDYLVQHGKPMRTLIYIGGHVMLYLGNTVRDGHTVPLVYQDVWGLQPADDSRRAVIGGSVIFPLLLRYPEDLSLQSLAGTKTFRISILGMPDGQSVPHPDEENPAG